MLASSVSIDTLIHLSNTNPAIFVATPINKCGLSPKSTAFVNRWLDATKANLFFAKGVVLVEGIAKAMLLPVFAKSILMEYNSGKQDSEKLSESLEDGGVSVINMNGIYFEHFMQLFCDLGEDKFNDIPIRCSGITDNDPPKEENPTPKVKVNGNNSALGLIDKINQSSQARLFSNELKTFEYDLAMEGENLKGMSKVLKELIKTDGSIKATLEKYEEINWRDEESENLKALSSRYILDHIESKGYYAQVLACNIEEGKINIQIPRYLVNAIIWASGGELNES